MRYETINLSDEPIFGFMPTMTAFILDDPLHIDHDDMARRKRPAVVICPGGGYGMRSAREAEPIALEYLRAGYNAFVVNYSVAPAHYPVALDQLSLAVSIIRDNADDWMVDANKIAVCGFSAGGHLAASLGTLWQTRESFNGKNKPNGMILCYPVITGGEYAHRGSFDNLCGGDDKLVEELSLENRVTKNAPPAFIWHTFEDNAVPVENSLMFAMALRKEGINTEMHIYPHGRHGLSLSTDEVSEGEDGIVKRVQSWVGLSIEWLGELFDYRS